MDNFNGFPVTYQWYQPNWYYQPTQTTPVYQPRWQTTTTAVPQYQQNQQQANNTNIIWIQGEEAAKAQNVPNGCNMAFFDSENQCIYIKSGDVSGKPSLTILDYTERGAKEEAKKPEEAKIEYATKEQIDNLNTQFAIINEKLSALGGYATQDQLESLNSHIDNLSEQVDDIEDRLTSFGKPSQNNQNQRRNK